MHYQLVPIVICLSLTTSIAAATEVCQEKVLWRNQERSKALFLPESRLKTAAIEELPLPEHSLRMLTTLVDFQRNPPEIYAGNPRFGPDDGCRTEHQRFPEEPMRGATPLVDLLAKSPVVVVGRVLDVQRGWDAWRNVVGSVAWIEVEQVLHGAEPGAGSIIAILLEPGGKVIVGGTEICTVTVDLGLHAPQIGDQLLLAGALRVFADPRFLSAPLRFPIKDGIVQPQSYPNVLDREPIAISSLVVGLRSNLDRSNGDQ